MTPTQGYQPFPITQFQTGQFQYYQSWIRPDDAFDPLVNAYIFRGQLFKRNGTRIFGETGSLRYQNNEIVASGNGGSTYSGTLSNFPIEGTITFTALTSAGLRTATATGTGNLTGTLAAGAPGTSTIDYATGQWTLDTGGAATISAGPPAVPIVAKYTFTANQAGLVRPIMMITEFIEETTTITEIVVADTDRLAVFNTVTELFDPVQAFSQINFTTTVAGGLGPYNFSTGFTNIAPYSVSLSDGGAPITDNGTGGFVLGGNFASASINYTTGVVTFALTAPAAANYTITASIQGDYFTGNFRNLFNYINWRASDLDDAHLWMTNNVDRVTRYDGTYLSRPPLAITKANYDAFVNDITTCLDVKVLNNSLLLIRPTGPGSIPDAQMIRASAPLNPTNFAENVPGNGSQVSATTGDWLMSASYLRDALIVEFQNSCFLYKATGIESEPFRFYKINSTKSTNATYGSIEYDTFTTSMGAKGLCKCDGVNKDRYDLDAIDLYENIDGNNFELSQGKRFDVIQQSWMIYPSRNRGDSTTNCDKVIVYNWLEETWATYEIKLSCLGGGRTFKDTTWLGFTGLTWAECTFPWDDFMTQDLIPWMLGGDVDGKVYFLNDESSDFDKGTDLINASIVSKRWNPFIQQGQKATFGYVDFYYKVQRNSAISEEFPDGKEIVLYLNWYANNSDNPALTQKMTLDAPPVGGIQELYAWKRMYVNLSGEFLQLEIQSSADETEQGQFVIAGLVLWAKPSGRLTPGTFL